MNKNSKKKNEISVRSSCAEYLTYVSATGDSKESIEMRYEDENIWLTQKMMSELYNVDIRTINEHIKKIYEDDELKEEATIRKYQIVQSEGNRQVSREILHYNLQMIIAVGFKVNNERAVAFRKWANGIVKDYTIQGWAMDVDRLKNSGTILTKDYFEKQLEKIREIMTMEDWQNRLNRFLTMWDREILKDAGKVTMELAKEYALTEFKKYRIIQDKLYESDFDKFNKLETDIKNLDIH